ncbi:MAG TPA: YceI family protein [Burkholderiales bacterium]|nr:YceI family protein [Burkholderiales bacterium]
MKLFRISAALALGGLLASTPALALEFNAVQPAASRLEFTVKQMGVPVDGKFRRFSARMKFDPARPEAAQAEMEIDLASIDAGSSEANQEVAGKQWFDVRNHPSAKFNSTGLKALGGGRYELTGKLTIKGRTRDAVAPLTFKQEGSRGIFAGSLVIKRADFAIGEGPWADFATVANEIPVRFHIVAVTGTGKQ